MPDIKLAEVASVYDRVKGLARREREHGNFEKALKCIEYAADIAYSFNWIYTDTELEQLLASISREMITYNTDFSPHSNRIAFFDSFGWDNRGLTEQYLDAILSWDVELLFIFENYDSARCSNIEKDLRMHRNVTVLRLDKDMRRGRKIRAIVEAVAAFQPQKSLLHLHPASAVAVTAWYALGSCTRYMINLTDHAFWLGVGCTDSILEFRDYGGTVSLRKRGIDPEKLFILPFYPITRCQPFAGFPAALPQGKVIILTGGNYYKMYGRRKMFLQIIREIVRRFPETIILIAGFGDARPLVKFIKENSLKESVFLIGNRRDINHIFEQCDIYLSTFPLAGGLMSQFAAINGKPILAFSEPDIPCNFVEGFLDNGKGEEASITRTDFESFYKEARALIADESYRLRRGRELVDRVIKKDVFGRKLHDILFGGLRVPICEVDIDYSKFVQLYLEAENKYLRRFRLSVLLRFNIGALCFFPLLILRLVFTAHTWRMIFLKLKAASAAGSSFLRVLLYGGHR